MSERQVKVIFGILAALVAAWAGVEVVGGGGDDGGGELGLAAAVDGSPSVVRIYRAGGDSVRLEFADGSARVNGFPADSAGAASLFAALDTARADELVSRNPDNHGQLGVASSGADSVVVGGDGAPAFTFLLGSSGRGGRFVRRPGEDRVYLLEGPAATNLGRSEQGWRDRTVAELDTARVARIALERGGERTVLVREDGAWRFAGGGAADTSQVETLLGELSDLRASGDVPADSVVAAADFSSPDAVLRAFASADGGGDPMLVLRRVDVAEDGPHLIRRGDAPWTYALAGYQRDRVFPARSDLMP
ncbi:MAG: DUF4340 domain-containing protein [Gemmatimonadota bacterium]